LIGDSPGYVFAVFGAKHSLGNGTGRLVGMYESQFSYEDKVAGRSVGGAE